MSINFLKYFLLLLISIACTEVIDIDLNSTEPMVVVDARIIKDTTAWVMLSYTTDYFDEESAAVIKDATIYIKDSEGNEEQLVYTDSGIYVGSQIYGKLRTEYEMKITLDGETYTATSEIISPTSLFNCEIEESSLSELSDMLVYDVVVSAFNDTTVSNYYSLKFWVNDMLYSDYYYLMKDEIYDGDVINVRFLNFIFESRDVIKAELRTIDEEAYNYFSQLNDVIGAGTESSTLYNPQSNFGEGIVGYFMAYSKDENIAIVE